MSNRSADTQTTCRRESEAQAPEQYEVVAFCPECGAFETLELARDVLLPTRRFTQQRGLVYHDCGTSKPCRLFRHW